MPPIWRHLAADERGVSVARSCKALSASGPSLCVVLRSYQGAQPTAARAAVAAVGATQCLPECVDAVSRCISRCRHCVETHGHARQCSQVCEKAGV